MDTESTPPEEVVPRKAVMPPTVQKKLKMVTKQNFEFRTIRNSARVNTKDMVDNLTIKTHFENKNLDYTTFDPISQKPIEAVIHHLSQNTPAEDISNGLVDLGFDIIIIKQMMTACRSFAEGNIRTNLPS
jgi:uncharacterized Fe-S radical SAM superfamily protein PflX